ncbi:hypothetical protein AVEN_172220-1 [Araneus ventricosus]|uniref:Uncharacterized protein n=1 Tax=Araneus ventricosus TaxID=182803 RepID=A0A4Y2JJ89_ARAVE|nr:hypothetical protein AVEN_172220-1 [Araneus ventricosus]
MVCCLLIPVNEDRMGFMYIFIYSVLVSIYIFLHSFLRPRLQLSLSIRPPPSVSFGDLSHPTDPFVISLCPSSFVPPSYRGVGESLLSGLLSEDVTRAFLSKLLKW